ncbi:MAG: hypothetical protein ABJM26_04820 [Anderseniella sp.]
MQDSDDASDEPASTDTDINLFPFMDEVKGALADLQIPGGPKLESDHSSEILGLYLDNLQGLGTLVFESKGQAAKARRALEKCTDKSNRLVAELRTLKRASPDTIERLDRFAGIASAVHIQCRDDDSILDPELTLPIGKFTLLLNKILSLELDRVERYMEGKWPGSGRGAELFPREIALCVAKIYMDLRDGERPTFGRDGAHGAKPATPYTRAVDRIFKALDIKIRFRKPCEHVCESLDELLRS